MAYYKYIWWGWQIILVLATIFFMIFGIDVLIKAYRLNDPFVFIIVFFGSNLIILISAALLIGFVYRMIGVYRLMKRGEEHPGPSNGDNRQKEQDELDENGKSDGE